MSVHYRKWMDDKHHLPEFMRDFHDQKRVFKRIDEWVADRQKSGTALDMPNWISAHIYVVDYFLHFMAQHGYKLQRVHNQIEYVDLEATLDDFDRRQYSRPLPTGERVP